MAFDLKKISPWGERLRHFEDSEIASRIDRAKASTLSPKAKDCQRQLNEASSVWAVDGRKFLFIFSETNEDGLQKVSVWGLKTPGAYQRIKTVWVTIHDYLFEAVALFLTEYFELRLNPERYLSDAEWYYDIEDELKALSVNCPASLRPKQKLLRIWSNVMHRFNDMISELDLRILKANRPPQPSKTETKQEKQIPGKQVLVSRPLQKSADIDSMAEKIVGDADLTSDPGLDYLSAAIAYDFAASIHEMKGGISNVRVQRQKRIQDYCNILTDRVNETDPKNPDILKNLNLLFYVGELSRLTKYEVLEKAIGKNLRSFAEQAIRYAYPVNLDHLEFLVSTRRFNKRLPKALSDHIREHLDGKVHYKAGFWDKIDECNTLQGKLRRTWIQAMSLRLYGYNPNTSYTQKELSELIPDVIMSNDPDSLLLYARICRDSDFDSVQITTFDDLIRQAEASTTDKTAILKLHTARLLWQTTAKELVPMVGTHSPCVRPQKTDNQPQKPHSHPELGEHIAHYVKMQQQGVSMRDFCLVKDLPYEEFRAFYEAEMAEMYSAFQSDPYMRQVMSLPAAAQDEYARLMNKHIDCMVKICELMSKMTGKKIEVNDMIEDPDGMEKKIQEMQPIMRKNGVKDLATATQFILNYEELSRIETQIAAFKRKYGLSVPSSK